MLNAKVQGKTFLVTDPNSHQWNPEDFRELIGPALEQLPQRYREVFRLRFEIGLKSHQIAPIFNVSPRTIDTWMFRGLNKLREILKVNSEY